MLTEDCGDLNYNAHMTKLVRSKLSKTTATIKRVMLVFTRLIEDNFGTFMMEDSGQSVLLVR